MTVVTGQLRLPYPRPGDDLPKIAANFAAIERWARTQRCTTTDGLSEGTKRRRCDLRFPYPHPATTYHVTENFRYLERWVHRWWRGECCNCTDPTPIP